jgi:putative transcriptional regulator
MKQGTLLVAHPSQRVAPWHRSVILITEHTHMNTVGLILNHASEHTLSQVMASRQLECERDGMVYTGGPVNTSALVLVHTDTWYSSNTMQVAPGMAISSDNLMLEKLAMGDYPRWWRFCVGVSGWAPGQLAAEIAGTHTGSPGWLTTPATTELVWRWDGEKQWHQAVNACATEFVAANF